MPRTKTGRCRANRTRRGKEGDGEEIEKAGNDIKEKEGRKKKKKQRRKMAAECVQMHYFTPAVVNATCRERRVTRIIARQGQTTYTQGTALQAMM
jgi:hypothetical protein